MFTLSELNPHCYPTTPEIEANLLVLLSRMNEIRAAYGKPLTVTSCLRSQADQARINPKAPKSHHLCGEAIDLYDPKLEFTAWLKGDGAALAEKVGLWFEEGNKNWAHCQIKPPKSGRRWFLP